MNKSSLISFIDALKHIEAHSKCLVNTEEINLSDALYRILAIDITAPINVPPAANSAMDGYALRHAEWLPDKKFPISQRIAAGTVPTPLEENTCARIFTGAEIPQGTNIVVMQENAIVANQSVSFPDQPKLHENIRPKGQDITQGVLIFQKGKQLQAQHIGMLANLGINRLKVFKRLKVGVLTTGTELIHAGASLQKGQIYNSNGPMLNALITQLGHDVNSYQHVPDDPTLTEQTLLEMSKVSDVIISSGGVSVGEEDYVKSVIEKNGHLSLWKVAIKPGKPLIHGNVFNTVFLGLPGNPSSTLVTFHWFARLVLSICAGKTVEFPKGFAVAAGFARDRAITRDEFLRVTIENNFAVAHSQQSSGALNAACQSDGYLHIPAGEKIVIDKLFTYYPFSSF